MQGLVKPTSRRAFLATTGGAVAGSLVAPAVIRAAAAAGKRRVALVGTGIRGVTMWGKSVAEEYADVVDIVGLCDINPGRLEFAKGYMGVSCPTFSDFERMVKDTGAQQVVVTTVDATHDQFIVKGLELGCDVVTEKPLTTDEKKCQAILDAKEKSGRQVVVTFNYRYSPHRQRMKELLMAGRIGKLTSVDFHWYLDVYHGADYFRRWHGKERFSGTLFVHKASHHFDLLNWWVDSEPEEVFGYGALEYYGKNHAFRGGKCRGCPHVSQCRHYWDITKEELLTNLYVKNEQHDGYIRDGCVWSEEIDIFDKMAAQIRYANGVTVSYSCITYSPYEGYRIAFNGTEGRLEAWVQERQPWQGVDYDEIRITDNFGETHLERIPQGGGGHAGGDTRLKDRIFRDPSAPDPYRQAADVRDGAMAILIGIGARKSARSGLPVKIGSLTSLVPRAQRTPS
jgi:predicted dehydrogenase